MGAFAARLDEGHRRWLTGRDDDGAYVETVGDNPPGPRLLWPLKLLPPFFCGAYGLPRGSAPAVRAQHRGDAHQSTFVREMLSADPTARGPGPSRRRQGDALAHSGRSLRGAQGLLPARARRAWAPDRPIQASFARQLLAFPNGEHDDLVDAAVYGADLNGTGNDFYFTAARR